MHSVLSHRNNRLLGSLPSESYERLSTQLEWMPFRLGQILHEQHVPFDHVYFPTNSAVSLVSLLEDGASAEIGSIGNEGMVGTSVLMGGGNATCRAVVQSVGEGYRLRADCMKQELDRSPDLLALLLRFVQALMIQTSQTAVCNRHHTVDQQLCRWLLLTLDRISTNQVSMTQVLIAQMLGVRREGVTAAAGKLQDAGLIRYSRGTISVLNRKGLEARSCECYETVQKETDRLVPMPERPRDPVKSDDI